MSAYRKPYTTIDQQISLLRSRGMKITDEEKAKTCLARIGYYRLSAYWHPNRIRSSVDSDNFQEGTTFSNAMAFYTFDKKLRLIVLDALERVEIGLRAEIVALLGERDPLAHLNPAQLHGNFARRSARSGSPHTTKLDQWKTRLDKKFRSSTELFAEHFKRQYPHDKPPLWIAAELWDFGMLSHFFDGMTFSDKNDIAKRYELPSGKTLVSWIRNLNDVRNICAHHSRLWNRGLVHRPEWQTIMIPDLKHVRTGPASLKSLNRLYASVVMLAWLLKTINPSTSWRKRLVEHVTALPNNPYVTLASAGFPEDWKQQNLWAV